MISGNRVKIGDFKLSDAYQMMNWRRAEDMLKREYHFLTTKSGNVKKWYDARVQKKNMMSFTIKTHDGKVIGFISIRDINKLFKSAVLGITFDLDYTGLGYGTESLDLFLKYYFKEMKMKRLYLDVAKHNKRAINCYRKMGFKLVKQYYMKLEEEYYDTAIEQLQENRDSEFRESFWILGPFILVGYYKMKLSKKVYNTVSTRLC